MKYSSLLQIVTPQRKTLLLILDEATAMFDPEGEKSFIEECKELMHQRTVLLITHRPASLALADRVLKMEQEPGEPISTVIRLPS